MILIFVLVSRRELTDASSGWVPDPSLTPSSHSSPMSPVFAIGPSAERAGRSFLDAYVDPDGRVVRRDQDGDTVSEGQAYAMLVSAALRDEATFDAVWSWTQKNLLRPDQTLSWLWRDGSVVDSSSASDADLDAARALVMAGRVFQDVELTAAGIRLGRAILDEETVYTPLGRIMVAGSWARQEPYVYNPSYPSPVAFGLLQQASGDQRWIELSAGSHNATRAFLDRHPLPPDWGEVDSQGHVQPTAGAAGRGNDGVQYGYDAARLALRYAESCSGEDVTLAARLSAPLSQAPQHAAVRNLDGGAIGTRESVVAIAGLAAAHAAAGDWTGSQAALLASDQLQQQQPSYYGGAWRALGWLLLTDRTLGGCPPLTL
jgi:endo-1,4-beta-D-glucanase Y